MSTTNDEQAKYDAAYERIRERVNAHQVAMEEAERPKREPLLSDEQIDSWASSDWLRYGAKIARDFYEEKIASGDLMVVKTTKRMPLARVHTYGCEHCGTELGYYKFCPGCGAKIIP